MFVHRDPELLLPSSNSCIHSCHVYTLSHTLGDTEADHFILLLGPDSNKEWTELQASFLLGCSCICQGCFTSSTKDSSYQPLLTKVIIAECLVEIWRCWQWIPLMEGSKLQLTHSVCSTGIGGRLHQAKWVANYRELRYQSHTVVQLDLLWVEREAFINFALIRIPDWF